MREINLSLFFSRSMRSKLLLILSIVALATACGKTYPEARQLAIEMADELMTQACHGSNRTHNACRDRNVRQEADWGTAIYIYIYGVNELAEIRSLVSSATVIRDKRNKQIPVYLIFYADLTKKHKITTIKLKENKNADS